MNLFVNLVVKLVVNFIVNLIVNLVVNTLSSKRLDAKRHYVILAKALDGIWPVGHACAVLCRDTAAMPTDIFGTSAVVSFTITTSLSRPEH